MYGNITLPEKAINDVSITWETDHPEIVDIEAHDNEGYDATPAGTVTRPTEDTEVTMTATLKSGKATDTKSFTFLVKAAKKALTARGCRKDTFSRTLRERDILMESRFILQPVKMEINGTI